MRACPTCQKEQQPWLPINDRRRQSDCRQPELHHRRPDGARAAPGL